VIRRAFFTCWLLTALLLALSLPQSFARAADGVEIVQAHLEPSEEGYKLSATFDFELPRGLEDAIARGFPLYFTTDVIIMRPRWYWFDQIVATESQTIRISHNLLTRQYRAAITDSLQQNFGTLEDALSLIKRPNRWVVANENMLKPGETYTVGVRMRLDVAQLSKPFQVHALNSSDWRFASEWKYFSFKAENK
jgi:hypothetical protein